MTAEREVVAARIEALFGSAMRADPVAIGTGLDLLTGILDTYSLDFLRRSRTTVLACGAALTGVMESHRLTVGDLCLSCGTFGTCRTLRETSRVFEAYLCDRPLGIDRAEALQRADALLREKGP